MLTLNEYQHRTADTAQYPGAGIVLDGSTITGLLYCSLGLAGEAGEVANDVKKVLRDDDFEVTPERREKIAKELGDVLWYAARVAAELDLDLNHIAELNLARLASRAERGVIAGSGSDR